MKPSLTRMSFLIWLYNYNNTQEELRLGQRVDYSTIRKRYSFMVRLVFDGVTRCGGVVISDR